VQAVSAVVADEEATPFVDVNKPIQQDWFGQWATFFNFSFPEIWTGGIFFDISFRESARHVLWWDVVGVSVYGSIIMLYLFFHLELGIISTTCNPENLALSFKQSITIQPACVWLSSCQRINLFTLDTFPFDKTRHHSCQRRHRNSYFKRSIQTLCVCNEDIM